MEIRPEHAITLLTPLTYGIMVAVEHVTCQRWPSSPVWQLTGLHFFAMIGTINGLVGALAARTFPDLHLLDGARLGALGGALAGYLVLSLGNALLHRAYHRWDWLWRHVHQLHHAPARLDVAGVMYQTPLEALANALLFCGVSVLLLGLDPVAAALCAYIGAFYGMFQHFNIRTWRWLGWIIQRPEAHCVHHRRGVHAYNYSDLPLWDLLWGTFRNPRHFHGELGFGPHVAAGLWPLLAGRDVNAKVLGPRSRGASEPAANPA